METYIERNAQWAAVHSSMSMGEPPWSFHNAQVGQIMLAAAQLHDRLQPYLYSFALRATEDGFPWTMTPLPIAYPQQRETYARENAKVRGYEWLIGDALLATPLYGNDYATGQTRDVYLPPGQWMDYDTGKLYQGNTTLTGFALPAAKTPLFVGGSGVVLEKKGETIVARVYAHAREGKSVFTLPGATQKTTVTVSLKNTAGASVRDGGSQMPNRLERFAWEFTVDPGHTYQVALPVRCMPIRRFTAICFLSLVTGLSGELYSQTAPLDAAAGDFANLTRYKDADSKLPGKARVVFLGDSITDYWGKRAATGSPRPIG